MNSKHAAATIVSRALDRGGYSPDSIRSRREIADQWGNKYTWRPDIKLVGSKVEGLTCVFESDYDWMIVMTDGICVESITCLEREYNYKMAFVLDTKNVAPGYARLRLENPEQAVALGIPKEAMIQDKDTNSYYLSSNINIAFESKGYVWSSGTVPCTRTGPARTFAMQHILRWDEVISIPFSSREMLNRWKVRPRRFGWPSSALIEEISNQQGFVVPVGIKGSVDSNEEWRICFTSGEILLIRSLNETQTKVYILLKNLSKSCLKPVCSGITSYVMKNVVMWMAELNPPAAFTEQLLLALVYASVCVLRFCVRKRFLPNYMIPDRNMLLGKLDDSTQRKLLDLMDSMVAEGDGMLLRCPWLRQEMVYVSLCPLRDAYTLTKRDMLENVFVKLATAFLENIYRSTGIYNIDNIFEVLLSVDNFDILGKVFSNVFGNEIQANHFMICIVPAVVDLIGKGECTNPGSACAKQIINLLRGPEARLRMPSIEHDITLD